MKRAEVFQHLLEHTTEDSSLLEIFRVMCQLKLDTTPKYDREWLDELQEEVELEELVKGVRLPAVPSRAEMRTLLGCPESLRDRLIFRVSYVTGIRVSELLALVFGDLDYDDHKFFIRSGKQDIDRVSLGDAKTFRLLREWQGDKPLAQRVFPLSVTRVQELVKIYGEKTGLLQKYAAMGRYLSPHCFRHAFATHCYARGMDLITLKNLLGHEFLQTTEVYVQAGMEIFRPRYLACHPLVEEGDE